MSNKHRTHDLTDLDPRTSNLELSFNSSSRVDDPIVRHGFGLRGQIEQELHEDYHSAILDKINAQGYERRVGQLTLRLAEAFGFCYGVDKAIDFAYETRCRFPHHRIFLTNEIIHNPQVNRRLLELGIRFLSGQYADGTSLEQIEPSDVVILPAFGADANLLARLRTIGCVLVDTTCGSVVYVWKRVEKYARDGFTAVIHGKWAHEETIATCSHVTFHGGHYLIVRDEREAARVCDYIRTDKGAETLPAQFQKACSADFDFSRHLARIGCANQTTMLSSVSLAIAEMFRQAMIDRFGADSLDRHFRTFDTICHSTQERQDAVLKLMRKPPDLMLVVGGFNSSNTSHLREIAAQYCPTYHVDGVGCLISPRQIRHWAPAQSPDPEILEDWLPSRRPLEIGLTAGASTPNKVIGEVFERLIEWEEEKVNAE